MKIKPQDLNAIRDQVQIAVRAALQEALKTPLHVKFLSNVVSHDLLQPEGDLFNVNLRIEVHPRKVKETDGSQSDNT